MLSSPETAQRGNLISALGMLLAIIVTLMSNSIISYQWLSIALIAGALVGASAASFVKMTTMPELVALFNGFGGIASLLVGSAEFLNITSSLSSIALTAVFLTVLIGGVTFTGSLLAFGKLSEIIDGKPFQYIGQRVVLGVFVIFAFILEAANSVLFVPGYGMAVSQAQHSVRELGELLEENGCEVNYGIHPVAGRMPGHMNVLLAEANVSYDLLVEPDDVNPIMDTVDVCVVIGANDVVNPDARENEGSPIYGMPVIEVDRAKTVFILKRSMASGFAGIDNPLFLKENSRMLFGDAKESISTLVSEFKS